MANVFDAMKRHQAEQAEAQQAQADQAQSEQGQGQSASQAAAPGEPAATEGSAKLQGSPAVPSDKEHALTTGMPYPGGDGYAPTLQAYHDRGGKIAEQFRSIRTSLLAQHADRRFCILMTSAEPQEGKTVSTLNLSIVLAERQDLTTIVVDADLRRPRVGAMLKGKQEPGLAEYLRGKASISEVIQPTIYPNLSFIAAGQAKRGEVSDLIGRMELDEMVAQLRRQFDCVLLDCPPVNNLSDVCVIGRIGAEAVMVTRMNRTNYESVERAIRLLHAANIKVSGMILTHQEYYIPNYLYRYS